jgi:hypothetical protein
VRSFRWQPGRGRFAEFWGGLAECERLYAVRLLRVGEPIEEFFGLPSLVEFEKFNNTFLHFAGQLWLRQPIALQRAVLLEQQLEQKVVLYADERKLAVELRQQPAFHRVAVVDLHVCSGWGNSATQHRCRASLDGCDLQLPRNGTSFHGDEPSQCGNGSSINRLDQQCERRGTSCRRCRHTSGERHRPRNDGLYPAIWHFGRDGERTRHG